MRYPKNKTITDVEKNFMLQDRRLIEAFTESQIQKIIECSDDLMRRVDKFSLEIAEDKDIMDLKKDKEWFTEEEISKYSFIEKHLPLKDRLNSLKDALGLSGDLKRKSIRIKMADEERSE
jgi:hypothetical protein